MDSKTLGDEAVGTFLQAPDAYLQANPVDALIMSPTAESGIDISIKDYFVRGYAFFCGVIDTDTQMQFLRRARACLHWSVWCQEYAVLEEWEGTRSPFARRLQAQILDYLQMDAAAALTEDERAERLQAFMWEPSAAGRGPAYSSNSEVHGRSQLRAIAHPRVPSVCLN